MAVRLLHPCPLFMVDLIDEKFGMDENHFKFLRREIDEMRKNDPKGRKVSNAGQSGWQSVDGIDKHPAFGKLWKGVKEYIYEDVWSFWGLSKNHGHVIDLHNSWANINEKGAWNRPHKHNGCWMSGALYIQAEGDEGDFVAMTDTSKVMGDFPTTPRMNDAERFQPRTGMLFMFPSGLTHMVEPNLTDNPRYSISFNMGIQYKLKGPHQLGQQQAELYNSGDILVGYSENELLFDITPQGKLIQVSTAED